MISSIKQSNIAYYLQYITQWKLMIDTLHFSTLGTSYYENYNGVHLPQLLYVHTHFSFVQETWTTVPFSLHKFPVALWPPHCLWLCKKWNVTCCLYPHHWLAMSSLSYYIMRNCRALLVSGNASGNLPLPNITTRAWSQLSSSERLNILQMNFSAN